MGIIIQGHEQCPLPLELLWKHYIIQSSQKFFFLCVSVFLLSLCRSRWTLMLAKIKPVFKSVFIQAMTLLHATFAYCQNPNWTELENNIMLVVFSKWLWITRADRPMVSIEKNDSHRRESLSRPSITLDHWFLSSWLWKWLKSRVVWRKSTRKSKLWPPNNLYFG